MNKALQLLSLARKGGRIEAGEEPVDTCIRMGRARLILLASDASEHTCRRIRGSVASSKQPYITIPFTKEELGGAIGRSRHRRRRIDRPCSGAGFYPGAGRSGAVHRPAGRSGQTCHAHPQASKRRQSAAPVRPWQEVIWRWLYE